MGKYIDLHLHSTNSDGERTVNEIAKAASENDMKVIAITDHNCFAIDEKKIKYGVEIVPGCEFSAFYDGTGTKREIHIVGLFYQGVPEGIKEIVSTIDRNAYIKALVKKIQELGLHITYQELREKKHTCEQLGRVQLAELIAERGYAKDKEDALDRWIGNKSPYYLNPVNYVDYISMEECVKNILSFGGLPILAHPFHYGFSEKEVEQMIRNFRNISKEIMGMEVYYQKYNKEEMAHLQMLADKYDLLPSASSDAHKRTHPFMCGDASLWEEIKKQMNW